MDSTVLFNNRKQKMTNSNERGNWKPKGRSGKFHIWHAGKNLYFVTEGEAGPIVRQCEFYGKAFSFAMQYQRAEACSI